MLKNDQTYFKNVALWTPNCVWPFLNIMYNGLKWKHSSQQAITCSKLTIETLEQGAKYVQS